MIEYILLTYSEEELTRLAGLDDAILGIESNTMKLIYSISKCIVIFMKDSNMDYEMAKEYFEFNYLDAYVGDKTPIFCEDEY
jgi:hypothetical protein